MGTAKFTVWGISGTGRAVGSIGQPQAIYVWDWTGTGMLNQWQFNGLAGTPKGEATAVSADGKTIFGHSPTLSDAANYYAYKATFAGTMPGPDTQLSTNALPDFPDTAGSTTLAIPFGCTPDGKYAVGMNYRGLEKAVLWDTTGSDPALWSLVDLTDLAASKGILGNFTRLSRAYSVGVNVGWRSGDHGRRPRWRSHPCFRHDSLPGDHSAQASDLGPVRH